MIGRTVMLVVIGLAGVVVSAPPPPPLATPRPDLVALTQDYWHWKTQDYPQFATQVSRRKKGHCSKERNLFVAVANPSKY